MNTRHVGNQECPHDVYIKGLCGNCGVRLDPPQQSSSVSMIHSVPELKVSREYAKEIGKADQNRLISERKLVLLVDLDHTILHTTHEPIKNDQTVHSFQLWPGHPIYYTKLRPHLKEFLDQMSEIYELHIFTFGCRKYAHKIASIIDPDKRYFGNRILSRDESVDQCYKKGNLNNLFPCGDAMVCIVDDRADVWRDAGNLIQVKAYTYFKTSISDGAMLGSINKSAEDDESEDERDADKLEALLGLDVDDQGDIQTEPLIKKQKLQESSTDVESNTTEKNCREEKEKDTQLRTDAKKNESDEEFIEDEDDHLIHLPSILYRIHEKWYMELDEQRRYLVEGESYKLPDIKDIIKKYLHKKS